MIDLTNVDVGGSLSLATSTIMTLRGKSKPLTTKTKTKQKPYWFRTESLRPFPGGSAACLIHPLIVKSRSEDMMN